MSITRKYTPAASPSAAVVPPVAGTRDASVESRRPHLARELAANLRTAATTVEALGAADKLLQELRNAPRPNRDAKARQVCGALEAALGHDPTFANFKNELDPAKRGELGFKILSDRNKPESALRTLLKSFNTAGTAEERAALFPAIQLAAKKAGLMF